MLKTLQISPLQDETLNLALKVFGTQKQFQKTIQELTELSLKIQHGIERGFDKSEITEEVADVFICLHYLVKSFGIEEVQNDVNFKINRLHNRIEDYQKSDY